MTTIISLGGSGGTPSPGAGLPKTQTINDLRLDCLCGNTEEVLPYNMTQQNSRIIAQKNNEKFLNRQINQRQKELSKLPKGIVKNRRSTINFKLPDTPPSTPDDYWADVDQNQIPGGTPSTPISGQLPPSPSLFDYDRDFPPLSKFVPEPPPSRETTFLSDGTISPFRAKLPHIAPLPSKPALDNFLRPITKIVNESNNTISLNPKKPPVEPIGQKQLSNQLQKFFPDVDETIQKESETFKERTRELDEIIEKLGKSKSSESDDFFDQVTFEFEFFNGGRNTKFDSFMKKIGLTNENIEFVDFCSLIIVKK